MTDKPVPLERRFEAVSQYLDEAHQTDYLEMMGHGKPIGWPEIDARYRTVILAAGGAGKTFEFEARARYLDAQGRHSFFIRIEDIDNDFEQAFEIGDAATFEKWRMSSGEAWFFLDSVDEARLSNPRAFEKALRAFAAKISDASDRAHICISSRPYAWQPRTDFALVDRLFPSLALKQEPTGQDVDTEEEATQDTGMRVFQLKPLDVDEIRLFAAHRSTSRIEEFITDIERADVMDQAGRPFDLEGLIAKWNSDGALGGKLALLQNNIEVRLREIRPTREVQQPLDLERAREGARLLAATVLLTGEPGINVPDESQEKPGIDAAELLAGWGDQKDIRALLERPLFNDVLYGMVRFRHRDVRELLAAEWFDSLLKKGHRRAVEALIFREQYGEQIITPRLRPTLPWLILADEEIRSKALALEPEIAMEGGDIAGLPIDERRKLLRDVMERLVSGEGSRSVSDNSAIARIAQEDLADDTLELITKYADHDDAIFFLGRLVWQGNMKSCVPALLRIAADSERGKYARIAATRAVMTSGDSNQKQLLWTALRSSSDELPRELLSEIIQNSAADAATVELLLAGLEKLPPYKRFEASGLTQAIHSLIEQMAVTKSDTDRQPLLDLIAGLDAFLEREPHMERRECKVSEEHAWLLAHASHAAERLVSAHVAAALSDHVISVMLKIPAVRFWRSGDIDEYKTKLHELVPAWPELNDKLFWDSIHQARERMETKDERLTTHHQVGWLGHYWRFGPERFDDVLGFVRDNMGGHPDDPQVALSLAFQMYVDADKPAALLSALQETVAGVSELETYLANCLEPQESAEMRKMREDSLSRQQRRAKEKEERQRNRSGWVAKIKANPDIVLNPPGLEPGQFSNDQYWLMQEIEKDESRVSRGEAASNWRSLVPEFGEEVARAFRDAAIAFWHTYNPALRSEGADTGSIPYALIFAMTGLSIEAQEREDFPSALSPSEVKQALRYVTSELNGFPAWLESFYKVFPQQVMAAIDKELEWELDNSGPDTAHHYILHDLVYYGSWLHGALAPGLIKRFMSQDFPNDDVLRHVLNILAGAKTEPALLLQLARRGIASKPGSSRIAIWYALWVDCEPETGIPALETWLASLTAAEAKEAAQSFITRLVGGRGMRREIEFCGGNFKQPAHLKSLYVLMHKYIRASEDIRRANRGVYSPELRDDAQDARNMLFNLLVEIPGKESYVAIRELITEHPDASFRDWMAIQARRRAVLDGDLEPWTAKQVREFGRSLTLVPTTNRELYDQGVLQLLELKHWLEQGNESPHTAWQAVKGETKIRNLVAGELNRRGKKLFRCAQENEFPNRQRPDIWLLNNDVPTPVPIELKVLDEGWSGPKLCERLRNQLVGDYLREDSAECGIMLLVWQGRTRTKRWRIDGKMVALDELADALKRYWSRIAKDYPGVSAIEVVVIDLTRRASKADD